MNSITLIHWEQNSGLMCRLYVASKERVEVWAVDGRVGVWRKHCCGHWLFGVRENYLNFPVCVTVFPPFLALPLLTSNNESADHLIQRSTVEMKVHGVCNLVVPVLVLYYTGPEGEWWPRDLATKARQTRNNLGSLAWWAAYRFLSHCANLNWVLTVCLTLF